MPASARRTPNMARTPQQKTCWRYKPDFVITEWANNDVALLEMRASYKRVVQRICAAPNHPAVDAFHDGQEMVELEDNQVPIGRELGALMGSASRGHHAA